MKIIYPGRSAVSTGRRAALSAALAVVFGGSLAFGVTNDHVVSFLMGPLAGFGTRASTYSWSFSYMEGFGDGWAWSITKLNEGHDDDHHRDGSTLQIWKRAYLSQPRLMLAAGVGPHFYCDTTSSELYEQGYENNHGAGVVVSGLARWPIRHPWWLEMRGNLALNTDKIDTAGLLFGVGYTFEPTWTGDGSARPANVHVNEVTVMGGANIVNSFGSETGIAVDLEYRRYLLSWLNATVAYIHEGTTDYINRRGLAPQLWWGRHFSEGRISMGFGVGPYFVSDTNRPDQPQLTGEFDILALASYTAAYHFDSGALLRMTWHRVVTGYDYNRDSDIILIGAGYGF